jgi:hypothetical protein
MSSKFKIGEIVSINGSHLVYSIKDQDWEDHRTNVSDLCVVMEVLPKKVFMSFFPDAKVPWLPKYKFTTEDWGQWVAVLHPQYGFVIASKDNLTQTNT